MKKFLALVIVAACSVLAVAANWPPSIIGTWQGTANQSTVKLVITSQGTTGDCKAINGTSATCPLAAPATFRGSTARKRDV